MWEWAVSLQNVADEILPTHTISEGGATPCYVDAQFQLQYRDERTRGIVSALYKLKQLSVFPYPYVTLSAETEQRVAEIQNDLSRYAEKTMARFVTGDIELTDENWEEFCRTADEKGLQEMTGIWQNAIQKRGGQ